MRSLFAPNRRIIAAFALALVALAVSGQKSFAGPIYTFTKSNIGGTNIGDFGTLELNDNSTDGSLLTTQVSMHFIMTDGKTLSISFNSLLATTTLQAADYKVYDSSNALLSGWSTTILDNVDGFGKFDISVGTNGAPNRIPEGTIIITLGSASDAKIVNFVDWSTGGDADRAPALFAAEYAPTTGNTGFVGSYGTEAAPAPPSVLLAASGALFCGLGGLVRRWRRPTVTA